MVTYLQLEFFILIFSTLHFVTVTFYCDKIAGSSDSLKAGTLVQLRSFLMLVILVDQVVWLNIQE